jgi:sulfur carrier protein
MQIQVNGLPREVAERTTVAQLLEQLDFDHRYLAVECNMQLVPRREHGAHMLAAGDRLEIVTLVGGG